MNDELYVGLMSGTSLDAIDAVIVDLQNNSVRLLHQSEYEFPEQLRDRLIMLITQPDDVKLDDLGMIHRELGSAYAAAVKQLLAAAALSPDAIKAIGCHGQTVRHQPDGTVPFTLQLGDAATLATATGIPVVNDFRSADIALGGEGAPLAPAFHQHAFSIDSGSRVIINIGGITNITVLKHTGETEGFDTGPGNTLLDYWCETHFGTRYDDNGCRARAGMVNDTLLDALMADSYFSTAPPKSTGREYFNAAWLTHYVRHAAPDSKPADVLATLTKLTAKTAADAILNYAADADVYVCGGGAANAYLIETLAACLRREAVQTTAALGLAPDWVEAAAFAWLAQARLQHVSGNVPTVTGATRAAILGAVTAP